MDRRCKRHFERSSAFASRQRTQEQRFLRRLQVHRLRRRVRGSYRDCIPRRRTNCSLVCTLVQVLCCSSQFHKRRQQVPVHIRKLVTQQVACNTALRLAVPFPLQLQNQRLQNQLAREIRQRLS